MHSKPISCNLCDKVFTRRTGLKLHVLSHTGEKPFECNECGNTYRQKKDLRTHILQKHTGNLKLPYPCDQCSRRFRYPIRLKEHYKMHSRQKEFRERVLAGGEVEVPVPEVLSHKPQEVEVPVPEPQECEVPVPMAGEVKVLGPVALEVEIPVPQQVQVSVLVTREVEVPVPDPQKVEVPVLVTQEVEVPVPIAQQVQAPVTQDVEVLVPVARENEVPEHVKYPYQCSQCSLRFSYLYNLTQHCEEHVTEKITALVHGIKNLEVPVPVTQEVKAPVPVTQKVYKCDGCDEIFLESRDLKIHRRVHVTTCKTCEKPFINAISLERHVCAFPRKTKPTFKCDDCSELFQLERELQFHNCSYVREYYECYICKESFSVLYDFECHMNAHINKYYCKLCDKLFHTGPELVNHYSLYCRGKRETYFKRDSSFIVLKKPKLNHDSQNTVKTPCYKCEQCAESFTDAELLGMHSLIHTLGKQPQKCDVLASSHTTKSICSCGTVLSYSCVECKQSFGNPNDLKMHICGERSYKCQKYSESFTTESDITSHISIPAKKTSYKCEICTKSFLSLIAFEQHTLHLHKGVKLYKCVKCERGFVFSRNLKIHSFSHTSAVPHCCKICHRIFCLADNLKKHLCVPVH